MIFTPKKMHFQSYKNAPSIQIIEQLSITNAIKCPSLTAIFSDNEKSHSKHSKNSLGYEFRNSFLVNLDIKTGLGIKNNVMDPNSDVDDSDDFFLTDVS